MGVGVTVAVGDAGGEGIGVAVAIGVGIAVRAGVAVGVMVGVAVDGASSPPPQASANIVASAIPNAKARAMHPV